jgi:copper chaperone
MKYAIHVDNLKCGGCANTITSSLKTIAGVQSVSVDVERSLVTIEGDNEVCAPVVKRLDELGYPEVGSAQGLHGALANAKSYLSCAIGKVKTQSSH